jgi:UDP-N-acetylmuramate dehydrogenase
VIEAAQKSALERALGDAVEFDVPMARHTSLRIGGPADAVATPASRDDLATLLDLCEQHQLPTLSIGAGFNLLVSDAGIDGVVIRLSRFRRLEQRSRTAVFAEAGVTHASLTRFCVERGLSGLEFGAGIPGVVGGWVTMNAGIGTREVVDVALEVEIVGPGREPARILTRDELDFSYRSFRNLPLGAVVVSVLFEVTPAEPDDVRSEVDRLLAQRARTQPLNIPSCGSVFKNPQGDFAGRLIEAAGLKGEREGGARISPLHANFIANTGGATAADVQRLMERAREAVEKSSGVRLEPEVRIVGRTA